MQQAQILTHGLEGVLAERLRAFAEARRCWLRETSQHEACRDLLHASPPSVFVLVLGRDIERELRLLDEAHLCCPGTTIVVGETDNPVLAGLAWDLGATYVLFPPTPMERLLEVIEKILTATNP